MKRIHLTNLVFLAASSLGGIAFAQEPAPPPQPPPQQQQQPQPPVPLAAPRPKVVVLGRPGPDVAPAFQPIAVGAGAVLAGQVLSVALNKSTELNLPAEARDIIIGSPDVADVVVRGPSQVYVVGRGVGQTNIYFRDRLGRTIRRVEVDVHVDTDALKEALHQVLPNELLLKAAAVGDSIYLSGSVRNDAAANAARSLARRFVKEDANVVNLLGVANDQQVLIRVKVAEIQKSALKELGVGTGYAGYSHIGPHENFSTGNYQPRTSVTNITNGMVNQIPDYATTFGGGVLTQPAEAFSAISLGIGSLATTFTVLESQNLLRTLEEPNLTAVSGETATMLAGGEFPVPVAENNGMIGIDFKKFGVGLSFTPVVLDPGRINLKLQTEVSDVDKSFNVAVGNLTIYGLKVRRAGTVVEMPSGGSIMIAGLLQNNIVSAVSGFPGLMDVPVLGQLFRSNSFQHDESELIVIVSAYIVQPTGANQLSSATDGFAPGSDLTRLLFNRLQDIYATSRDTPATPQQLQGPLGYIVQ